jgi:PKD repeat protein
MPAYLFETGPEGASLTAANTGAQQINPNGSGKFAAAAASSGTYGASFTNTTGGFALGRFGYGAGGMIVADSAVMSVSTKPSAASQNCTFKTLRNGTATTGAVVASLLWDSTNQIRVRDAGGSASEVVITSTALTPGVQYRVEVIAQVGTTTSNGVLRVIITRESTGVQAVDWSKTNANLGTVPVTFTDVGVVPALTDVQTITIDSLQYALGSATPLGDYVPPAAPTAAFTTAVAGLKATFDASGSTGAGSASINRWQWDFGNGQTSSSTSSSAATVTYASAGTYTVQLTVTDTNSLTSSISHNVTVLAPAAVQGAVGVSAPGYTIIGGAPDLLTAISDGDNTTGIQSPAGGGAHRVTLGPHQVPNPGSNWVITYDADMTGASTGSVPLNVYQGAATTALFTVTAQALVNVASGAAFTHTLTWTIPSTQWTAVTDWTNVQVGFVPAVAA